MGEVLFDLEMAKDKRFVLDLQKRALRPAQRIADLLVGLDQATAYVAVYLVWRQLCRKDPELIREIKSWDFDSERMI